MSINPRQDWLAIYIIYNNNVYSTLDSVFPIISQVLNILVEPGLNIVIFKSSP